jgi:MoaA/NifB/PqqE/SkfB family radical SAM enzyme
MFNFESLNQIQIEITNRCQASCPMCLRNVHGGIENPLITPNDWTLSHFKQIFNSEVLEQIKMINFCGDFGDPIINSDLIDMCQYLKDNSNISVHIHTNGSVRNIDWWIKLAKSLPESHTVEFAIDGLADTHHVYRQGTDYHKIMQNAKAFIDAGGNAHWMYIKFKHNEHQVDAAQVIASSLGFKSFKVKNSKRFGKKFPVVDRLGSVTHYIEQPIGSLIKPVEFVDLKNYKDWKSKINCFTLTDKELYIDAHGHVLPCCLIASFLYANYDSELYRQYGLLDDTSIVSIAREVQIQIYSLIRELGGLDALDAKIHGIKHIMSQPVWQQLLHKKWENSESSACTILCSSASPYISIEDQISRAS